MYLSKVEIDRYNATKMGLYDAHQALWKLFGDSPDRKRDFLYRSLENGMFLVTSARMPQEAPFVKRIEIKTYSPQLKNGDRVLFSLRCNPVVKRRNDAGRQVRVDMVQDARLRCISEGSSSPPRLAIAQNVANEWLGKRQQSMGLAIEFDSLAVENYMQDRFRKNGSRKDIVLSRIDVRGFASIENMDALTSALAKGVGCAKGFGFGMLMLRRA